jgi:hypothetical protein
MIVVWILVWIVILTFGFIVFRGAPYVPSRRRYIKRAFTTLYPLGKKDVLVDVGSGDGIVLRIASEYGATAIGYELNPILVIISRILSRRHTNARAILADFWLTPLPDDVTVVYAFMVTRDVKKMIHRITSEATRLGRSIRLISYGNTLPGVILDGAVDAYTLYTITPLQIDKP